MAFAGIFGGTFLGMVLRKLVPEHHPSSDSKDVMKLGIGTIATLAALVLALLIGSAKGTFDTISSGVRQTGSMIILLDRTMARYGPWRADQSFKCSAAQRPSASRSVGPGACDRDTQRVVGT